LTTLGAPALQLLQIVLARSTRDAAAFILAQLDAGQALATLVTEVLAPVQVEVGERWQRNALSTADEHAATAVVDNALATLALTGSAGQFVDRGSMAVVCAEGDWHTLPARMAAELWRWDGWDVIFLGGSLPPGDLGTWLSAARPDVLAVTCSVPLFIPGTLRVGETSAAAGVPCVVGGRGLGPDARRADALGLRWAASPAGLEAALDAPPPAGRAAELTDRRSESQDLESSIEDVVDAAIGVLTDRLPAIRDYTPRQMSHTEKDYAYIVRFLCAAVLCDDPRLFSEFLDWQQTVLTSRGLPPSVLPTSMAALADVIPENYRRAYALCRTAAGSQAPALVGAHPRTSTR